LLLDFWPLRRVSSAKSQVSGPSAADTPNVWRLLLEKVPFLALAVASSAVTFVAQQQVGAMSGLARTPLSARLGNALVSYARYLGKTFWPVDLALPYPHPGQWPVVGVALAAALLVGVSLGALWLARRLPFFASGWFWFLGTLVPMIGLVQVGAQAMADRFTYLPLLGIFWALVWALGWLVAGGRVLPSAAVAGTLMVLAVCAFQTRAQLAYWHDSGILFQHAVQAVPNNYLAENNLASWLDSHGRADEAIAHYRIALAISADDEQVLNNLGNALAKQGQVAEGIGYLQKALKLLPDSSEVHNNLGNALVKQGGRDEAEKEFRAAIKNDPDFPPAHNDLGNLLAMEGRFAEAEAEFHEALRCQPWSADARFNLGNVLALQGKFSDAIGQYAGALQLKPDYAQAQLNWGCALARLGSRDEAVAHLREALRLRPGYPEAEQQLKLLGAD